MTTVLLWIMAVLSMMIIMVSVRRLSWCDDYYSWDGGVDDGGDDDDLDGGDDFDGDSDELVKVMLGDDGMMMVAVEVHRTGSVDIRSTI